MNTEYLIASGLFLSCVLIRTTYELLKKAGTINPKSKPLFAAIFTVMCLLWISWFSLCPLDPIHFGLTGIVRWSALGIVIAGLVLEIGRAHV